MTASSRCDSIPPQTGYPPPAHGRLRTGRDRSQASAQRSLTERSARPGRRSAKTIAQRKQSDTKPTTNPSAAVRRFSLGVVPSHRSRLKPIQQKTEHQFPMTAPGRCDSIPPQAGYPPPAHGRFRAGRDRSQASAQRSLTERSGRSRRHSAKTFPTQHPRRHSTKTTPDTTAQTNPQLKTDN